MIAAQLFKPGDMAGLPGNTSSSLLEGSTEYSQTIDFKELINEPVFALESPLPFMQELLTKSEDIPALQLPAAPGKELPLSTGSVIAGLVPRTTGTSSRQVDKEPGNLVINTHERLREIPGAALRDTGEITRTPVETKVESNEIDPVLETRLLREVLNSQEANNSLRPENARSVFEIVRHEGMKLEASKEALYQPQLSAVTKTDAVESIRQAETPARLSINTPVQDQGWSEGFAGRISWMLNNNQHAARINVHPAELGPIEVKIQLNNEQASVNFVAGNQVTREAILEAFPRLREMLDEHGLNLHQGSVSDNTAEQGNERHEDVEAELSHATAGNLHEPGKEVEIHSTIKAPGLVDHFV